MKLTKNLSILKPAAAGLAGFAAAKALNNIPTGAGKRLGDNALLAGGAKIALAAFAPGMLGKRVPLVNEIAVGVAIAGVTDILRRYMPTVAAYVAAPALPSGAPFTTGRPSNKIACPDENPVKPKFA